MEVHGGEVSSPPSRELAELTRRMYERNVRVGLLVTPLRTFVVRDLLTSVQYARNRYVSDSVPTMLLLETTGAKQPAEDEDALTEQTLRWLEGAAAAWDSFVPAVATPTFVPEVVGQLAQSDFEVWDDVLGARDAVA